MVLLGKTQTSQQKVLLYNSVWMIPSPMCKSLTPWVLMYSLYLTCQTKTYSVGSLLAFTTKCICCVIILTVLCNVATFIFQLELQKNPCVKMMSHAGWIAQTEPGESHANKEEKKKYMVIQYIQVDSWSNFLNGKHCWTLTSLTPNHNDASTDLYTDITQ